MLFAHPYLLWLLLILIPIVAWYVVKRRRYHATLGVSTLAAVNRLPHSWKEYMPDVLFGHKVLTIAAVIIILCRPQTRDTWSTASTEGTDIVLALDISSSMLAKDFKPDRFEAAKDVATKFVAGRENDNIGLVIFAGESFTGVPLTNDRALVTNYINEISMGVLEDGTAIGDGLATAINRIKDGKAKSKSIILLTDGTNNTGIVAPLTAAEIAAKLGIKVYTIGVGTNGIAPYPQQDQFGRITFVNRPVEIDESTLSKIASMTGGKYFRATGNRVLDNVFNEINALEKTRMDVQNFSHTEDDIVPWAVAAIILIMLQLLLRLTVMRTIP